jgi:hypothetical protein
MCHTIDSPTKNLFHPQTESRGFSFTANIVFWNGGRENADIKLPSHQRIVNSQRSRIISVWLIVDLHIQVGMMKLRHHGEGKDDESPTQATDARCHPFSSSLLQPYFLTEVEDGPCGLSRFQMGNVTKDGRIDAEEAESRNHINGFCSHSHQVTN